MQDFDWKAWGVSTLGGALFIIAIVAGWSFGWALVGGADFTRRQHGRRTAPRSSCAGAKTATAKDD